MLPVHLRREAAPKPRTAEPPPSVHRPAQAEALAPGEPPAPHGPIALPPLPAPAPTDPVPPAPARKARPAPALPAIADVVPAAPGRAATGAAAPPARTAAAAPAPDVERVVRVVEEQARLAPPRSVVVDLDGDHGRIAVSLRGTEIHLAWDGANAALPEVRAFQRAVVAALTGRGFDVAGDAPHDRSHREPRAPRRSPPPGFRRRHRDTGLML